MTDWLIATQTEDFIRKADGELLSLFASRHQAPAFAELVRRHVNLVYNAAVRRLSGDTHAAKDITQQVFARLARNAAGLTRHTVLEAWLYATTRNLVVDHIRTEQRRKTREREAHVMQDLTTDSDGRHAWERVRPLLDAAVDELSEADRQAVLLRFFGRRSLAEVGRALSVSEDAARMRVDRALDKLHRVLARHGVTSTMTALSLALAEESAGAAPVGLAGAVTHHVMISGAAGPGTGIGGAIGFMTSSKIGIGVIAIAFAVSLGTATYEYQQSARAEHALAAAQAGHARQVRDLGAAKRSTADVEQQLSASQVKLQTARAAAEQAMADAATAKPWDPKAQGQAFLDRHPNVKQALADYVSAHMRFQYGPMYRALNLTPEQIKQWEQVRGAGMTMGAQLGDGRGISMPFGSPPGQTWGEELRAVVGDDGMKRLRKFESLGDARNMTAEVASALYFTDTPLTPTQSDTLVQILAKNAEARRSAHLPGYDWDAVIGQARGILAPRQVAVLADRQVGDLFQTALNRNVASTAKPAPKTQGTP